MGAQDFVPLVRCRLNAREEESVAALRYVPLAEFELWKHLMETRHRRRVTVEAVSVWIPENPARWNSGFAPEDLEPVLRVRIEVPGPQGVTVPVERYFPAETYPQAQEALLSHYGGIRGTRGIVAMPGYFLPSPEHAVAAVAYLA